MNYSYGYPYRSYRNQRSNNQNRGFFGPFLLGTVTGTLAAPLFYGPRPNNAPTYVVYPPYPPYPYYGPQPPFYY